MPRIRRKMSDIKMENILIWVFGLGSLWDVTTSFLGIVGIFGVTNDNFDHLPVYITALVGSSIILGLSLNAEAIWNEYADDSYKLLRNFHIVTTFFDAYTSYLGTAQNIILKDSRSAFITIGFGEVWRETTFDQKIILLLVTALVTLSPIALSKLRP